MLLKRAKSALLIVIGFAMSVVGFSGWLLLNTSDYRVTPVTSSDTSGINAANEKSNDPIYYAGKKTLYSRDADHVYLKGWTDGWIQVVEDADPATFTLLTYEVYDGGPELSDQHFIQYASDKDSVFISGELILNADPKTFQVLKDTFARNSIFAKDANHIYQNGEEISADPSSFEVISPIEARDGKTTFRAYSSH